MWTAFAIVANLLVCAIVAVPTQNTAVRNFQATVHHQDLQSILMAIEERLRNLDNIYSMHLSPTLEDKLEQYQRKLESIDTKLIRLESLVMLNLDNISENISTRNFKEDVAKTNLVKKIDAMYEGLSHRLNYIDRRFESSASKMQTCFQGKLETTLTRIEKMDENLSARNEEIDVELSDAIAAIDDLKTSYSLMEETIVNNTNENFEISLKEQMLLMKSFNDKSNKVIQSLYENTTRDFVRLERKIEKGLEAINESNHLLDRLKRDLKSELNEYAIKVAEMNSENWKTGSYIQKHQNQLETMINSTKAEVQSGIRSLIVLLGKTSTKPQLVQGDQARLEKLTEKIDSNFEKVLTTQNLFLDSCYRVQMDESQIESKISDILEQLIETFDKKTAIELKDIQKLEKLIKSHDAHITKNLHQANTNVVTIYDKMSKDHKKFEVESRQVGDHINALFSLIQDTLADKNGSLSSENVNLLVNGLSEMERKISSLNKQGDILGDSVGEIKRTLEDTRCGNSSEVIDEFFKNISRLITRMEVKINTTNKISLIKMNRTEVTKNDEKTEKNLENQGKNDTNKKSEDFKQSKTNKTITSSNNIAVGYGSSLIDVIDTMSGEDNFTEFHDEIDVTTEMEEAPLDYGENNYEEFNTNVQPIIV